jgi:hypothetical protein
MASMRLAFLLAAGLIALPAFADNSTKTIIVSSDDGYGTTSCLASGEACGKVVADAMCAGEGFPRAHRFGPAAQGDLTAGIKNVSKGSQSFVVECGF